MRQQGRTPVRHEVAEREPPDQPAARAQAVQQEYGNALVGAVVGGERLGGLGDDVLGELALSWIGVPGESSNQERLARLKDAGWLHDGEDPTADPFWAFPSLFEG